MVTIKVADIDGKIHHVMFPERVWEPGWVSRQAVKSDKARRVGVAMSLVKNATGVIGDED